MRIRALAAPLLLTALGVLGCGASANSEKTTTNAALPVPDETYRVALSGSVEVPPGAPAAHGRATITLNAAQHELCWMFRLVGVAHPVVAHVHAGPAGTAGPVVIPLGPAYAPNGCTSAVPRSLITRIEAAPSGYYVNIHTAAYPKGVVRAQL